MDNTLFLEVVTPERVVVSQEVDTVIVPGSEGEFGVLPGHVLFLSGVIPGELRFSSGTKEESIAVTNGFAEVSNNKVSILVDAAEKAAEIDLERAKKALERAKKRLESYTGPDDVEFMMAEAALQRAIARIKVAQKNI
ncbi:MAG: F0F1 ATP synthase subunit epsilon [Deltaproteobacteria bacterium]|nr:F0F1 ATP synthase subunit epsilon [Deltaproteobacteria bacterium]MBW2017073.1 F0F1 ATP synthase subunit epsilon [Deltaproteobacteria bacterium]MBW2127764.1 F0F1 ATP synthase subunit epsilon [Deltaproteobacteria bacterium]MBW2303176.1 F0F1 ATP synthase subunit epsilon [Deltaproteobacteria bacterium]